MVEYRKKPIIVDAECWHNFQQKNQLGVLPDIFSHEGGNKCSKCGKLLDEHGTIPTLKGKHIVCPGDWIILGVKGECYPIKPDIFEQDYELDSTSSHRKLFNICKKIQLLRDAYNKNNEPFDSEELDKLLDEAIEKEEKQ